VTSSVPEKMDMESTDDSGFGTRTNATGAVAELPVDTSLVEPDEALTSVKNITD
jgi:hypothetical protein